MPEPAPQIITPQSKEVSETKVSKLKPQQSAEVMKKAIKNFKKVEEIPKPKYL